MRLSELGTAFLRDCAELVARTTEVVDQMRDVATSPAGRLRVHALPGFVLGHGTPRHPRDLMGHRIGWYSGYPTREKLALHGPGGRSAWS